jgi:D-glycero-D-manno-heptose 1,7-bisphosphate phosphatase
MTSAISDTFKDWTLFLDRDGVINVRLVDDYVKRWDEFVFLDEAIESIIALSGQFARVVVVTNQQGVGKGLMQEDDLKMIHSKMVKAIAQAGGKIDRVYYCTALAQEGAPCRKPNPGMALQAKHDFPEINFKKSLMVGDSLSDVRFGKNLGMTTVLVASDNKLAKKHPELTDFCFENLKALAGHLPDLKTKISKA